MRRTEKQQLTLQCITGSLQTLQLRCLKPRWHNVLDCAPKGEGLTWETGLATYFAWGHPLPVTVNDYWHGGCLIDEIKGTCQGCILVTNCSTQCCVTCESYIFKNILLTTWQQMININLWLPLTCCFPLYLWLEIIYAVNSNTLIVIV